MKVISVKFKESGRAYYFDPKELEITLLQHLVLMNNF